MAVRADNRMIRAVFIDIDDTLLSFQAFVKEAMFHGFAEFNLIPFQESMLEIFHRVNDGLWRRIETGEIDLEYIRLNRWNLIFRELGITGDGVAFEKYFRDYLYECAIPENNSYEMMKDLGKNYILCAASNGPYDQQVHRLEISDFLPMFDHVFISEKIGVPKPSALFFDRAFAELNSGLNENEKIIPSETLMIGDSMSADMAGAYAYGMKTLLFDKNGKKCVPNPHMDPEKLDFVVSDLGEVAEKLRKE